MKKAKEVFRKVMDKAVNFIIPVLLVAMIFGYDPSNTVMFLAILIEISRCSGKILDKIEDSKYTSINKKDLEL